MTDRELVARAIADPDAYAPIVEMFERPLIRFIRSLSRLSHEDAEDIAQQVFLKAYGHLNDFDPKLKLSTWLFAIARNSVISEWRRRQARPQEYAFEDVTLDSINRLEATMATDYDARLTADEIRGLLALLTPEYREVIALYYFEDKSYDEIADIIRRPVGTVAALLSRGRRAFADLATRTGAVARFTLS